MNSDWVLKRLAELAEADISVLFDGDYELRPLDDLPDAARRLIASVEFEPGQGRKVRKLKLLDRLRVLELIGKHVDVSAFRESVSHSVNDDLLERLENARRRIRSVASGAAMTTPKSSPASTSSATRGTPTSARLQASGTASPG